MSLTYFTNEAEAGETVGNLNYLELYCDTEDQNLKLMQEVIESVDRTEYYLYDSIEKTPIGVLALSPQLDMHHGLVCVTVAHWILPDLRCASHQRDVLAIIKNYCKEQAISKFQRFKHISVTHQLIITKEVS